MGGPLQLFWQDKNKDFRMNIRSTSVEAYDQIKRDGMLAGKHIEIYKYLFTFGPLTANQIFRGIKGSTTITQANIHARLNELKKYGVVSETGKVLCKITGKTVLQVDVTDKLPIKPAAIIRNKEKIDRLKRAYKLVAPYAPKDVRENAKAILMGLQ